MSVRPPATDVGPPQLVKPLSRQCAVHFLLDVFVRERNSSLNLEGVFGACRGGAVHLAFLQHAITRRLIDLCLATTAGLYPPPSFGECHSMHLTHRPSKQEREEQED